MPNKTVALFVSNIWVFDESHDEQRTVLPFFADGYPGLIFYKAKKALTVYPHNKTMSAFFIYGQTLNPIELMFHGSYRMVVFQFYPFILNSFFGIAPKTVNDDCFDLLTSTDSNTETVFRKLQHDDTTEGWIATITDFLLSLFSTRKQALDVKLKQALQRIIDNRGLLAIKDLCRDIRMSERTLERRFLSETGLSPKQFAKIIQFQSSLEQLSVKDYNKLTDIVYRNGYADQSHFIKVFKVFTGRTPKEFLKE
ncbi:AraC-type DNA-binding protein [Parapedobacter composti]|uniref:AraC-type DNA-binding protein n=1 Tax=Parapedobacter composti TaxID=623281 RepID=A0A1I1F298_9SPHI|nr:AraC family transcriptional regulator [Parapedobacter composti]SFB93076.1 AraC-type DNA-binding protein [Parapedobacter composti]